MIQLSKFNYSFGFFFYNWQSNCNIYNFPYRNYKQNLTIQKQQNLYNNCQIVIFTQFSVPQTSKNNLASVNLYERFIILKVLKS